MTLGFYKKTAHRMMDVRLTKGQSGVLYQKVSIYMEAGHGESLILVGGLTEGLLRPRWLAAEADPRCIYYIPHLSVHAWLRNKTPF